jgi:hypothetical protein
MEPLPFFLYKYSLRLRVACRNGTVVWYINSGQKQCKTIAKTEKQPDRMHYSKPKKKPHSLQVDGDAMWR